ncbi:TolC family protein [Sulfurimonas lithotrophica]|uniref:TolC family protein n=1 Tax=Sulfurimonas lithotrophica TaxID=2590022 RepID=A0A5P8P2Q9_9BACT|nr:TolC family protein [Sulfurimonas lithotrophica]QFR50018.1 TolC family protein [Sulfurimonas lithotrophica]
MKSKLFLVFFFSIGLYAQNLSQILDALQNSKKTLSIKQQTYSNIAQSEQFITQDAPELGVNLTQADESTDSGMEYSLGISQNLSHPFSSLNKEKAVDSYTKALNQESKHKLHILRLDIASKYHLACISKEITQGAELLLKEQNGRFNQLESAYNLGEISKKDLLFNKLDLAKLQQTLIYYKRMYLSELSEINELIDNLDVGELSCNDLVQISRDIKLKNIDEHAQIKSITYKQNSAKSFYDVYNSSLKALTYELSYEKELEATRYSFGISFPLSFLSSQNQKQKAEFLHKNSALSAQKESLSSILEKTSNSLKTKVQTLYDEYILLNKEILPMSLELKNLSKTALYEGEGSIMEYLDSTRSYTENMLQMLQSKKNYYYELFELYKKADIDLGENL